MSVPRAVRPAPWLALLLGLVAGGLCAAEVVNANVASREQAPLLRENQPFQAVVTVRNPYPRAVRITQIDSTCACSKLELASRFLIPGETTTLEVHTDNLRRSGPQQLRVSLFVSDPEFEPIEVWCWWRVREIVAVDALPPGAPLNERPADAAWRDVYRFVVHERPDEPQRLRRRIRLSTPPEETPTGGLRVERIDYAGQIWRFVPQQIDERAVLIVASARETAGPLPEGDYDETVTVITNHPDKREIALQFQTMIDRQAGRRAVDPLSGR
ncbi:MAG: DUF1573 domain-containing protein [Planctomycetota bacterium]|nr:DUF1573 domain-containing protein [Planctomycetota bacterium]MCX8040046.1 DUF1573 domain-containing protein [Planctomycetota bacterium]MDW8373840.1 DUF1573 domain-containing protein [Planctomycetota bacterium]